MQCFLEGLSKAPIAAAGFLVCGMGSWLSGVRHGKLDIPSAPKHPDLVVYSSSVPLPVPVEGILDLR